MLTMTPFVHVYLNKRNVPVYIELRKHSIVATQQVAVNGAAT